MSPKKSVRCPGALFVVIVRLFLIYYNEISRKELPMKKEIWLLVAIILGALAIASEVKREGSLIQQFVKGL
jgi:hypothetical protein